MRCSFYFLHSIDTKCDDGWKASWREGEMLWTHTMHKRVSFGCAIYTVDVPTMGMGLYWGHMHTKLVHLRTILCMWAERKCIERMKRMRAHFNTDDLVRNDETVFVLFKLWQEVSISFLWQIIAKHHALWAQTASLSFLLWPGHCSFYPYEFAHWL